MDFIIMLTAVLIGLLFFFVMADCIFARIMSIIRRANECLNPDNTKPKQ